MTYVLVSLFAYLLGSLPSLWIVGIRNRRKVTAHSPLMYAIGLKRSLGVVGIDFAKGLIATTFGLVAAGWGGACLAALLVNAGTIFPVFNAFQGTKRIGTAAGSLLILSPLLLLAGMGMFILVLFFTRYLSLSAIVSTVTILILAVIFPPSWLVLLVIFLLGAGVFYVYRNSFSRLITGKEPQFQFNHWRV